MKRWIQAAGFLLGSALVAAGLGPSARAQAPAQPPSSTSADPIDLFKEIYPVFSHPRCVNCHGVVETVPGSIRELTGRGHGGGAVRRPPDALPDECGDCHNEPEVLIQAWQFTAPPHMSFVGKDLEQMCAMQSDEVRSFDGAAGSHAGTASGSYMHHLTTDPLIEAGFAGRAGGRIDPPQPPPMKKADFLAAAQKWVDAGVGCGRLTGTIKQVESFEANYAYPFPPNGGETSVAETAKREVTINRYSDGTAVATVSMSGHGSIRIRYTQDGCKMTITNLTDWLGTSSNPMDLDHLEIKRDGGSYEISFAIPKEKTQQTISGTGVNTCGAPTMSSGPETDPELTWSPWIFAIRCPPNFTPDAENTIDCDVDTSKNPPVLSGKMVRTVLGASDAAERQSWLNESPVGTSRADDGTPIRVKVETTWNLTADR